MRNWFRKNDISSIVADGEATWDMPVEDLHRYGIGQPLWLKPEHAGQDFSTYIAMRFYKGVFGDWNVEMQIEGDTSGQLYIALEDQMTDEPTVIHPKHPGIIHLTSTGRPLKEIRGGFE